MSRRHQTDMDFGSDSFLDIIANIVGILIILIVIAGVRVSQQAVVVEEEPAESKPVPAETVAMTREPAYLPPAPSLPPQPAPSPLLTDARPIPANVTSAILSASEPKIPKPLPTPESLPPKIMPGFTPKTPQPIPVSKDLLQSIAALNGELESLSRQSRQIDQKQDQYRQWNAELKTRIAGARQTLQQAWDKATERRREMEDLKRSLEQTRLVFIGKQKELQAAEKLQPDRQKLRHKLTPISRVVEGNEIHFHVRENRVAYVPLMELIERMKPQIQRQKDWLLKYREHSGRVGPHRGFRLDYVVVRQRLSAIESARSGGAARVLPIMLKFLPEEDFPKETLDQALRPGSIFIRELQTADVNTTLTFWVYPDSYGMYRQLKEFAHAEGFTVAARPLEEGEVIKASPFGSKSSGQ